MRWTSLAALCLCLIFCGCPDMKEQPRYDALEGHAPVGPPPGTVPAIAPEQAPPLSRELIERGRERFNIYCGVCHGADVSGKGMVAQRAVLRSPKTWVAPTDLHSQAVVDQPVGRLFDSISNGVRNMPGYAAQISYQDRWAIVLYVRALQRSQAASASDIPEGVNLR